MLNRTFAIAAVAWAAATAVTAAPLPITGGVTAVSLNAAPVLVGAGLSVAPLGSAALVPGSNGIPLAYFPVTGGSIDTGTFAGTILHDGSGLALTGTAGTMNLTSFVIDTAAGLLSGNVAFGSTSLSAVPLFTLGGGGLPGFPFSLTVTEAAGGALAAFFGLPNLAGATFGAANTVPITSAVPEPATAASMLAGLLLMGTLLKARVRERRA